MLFCFYFVISKRRALYIFICYPFWISCVNSRAACEDVTATTEADGMLPSERLISLGGIGENGQDYINSLTITTACVYLDKTPFKTNIKNIYTHL